MLHYILKNNVFSHANFTALTLMVGLSTVLSGCSAVMSNDNSSYVGAVADYTPFSMDDDDSIFSNKTPKKPAYLQQTATAKTSTTSTNGNVANAQIEQTTTPPSSPTLSSPVMRQQQGSGITTASIAQAQVPKAGIVTAAQPALPTLAPISTQMQTPAQASPKQALKTANALTHKDRLLAVSNLVNTPNQPATNPPVSTQSTIKTVRSDVAVQPAP